MARIKWPTVRQNVVTGFALSPGNPITIRDPFPLGEGYYTMNLTFNHVLVVGTGTGAISLGEVGIIKDIQIKADFDDIIVKACGKALYYRGQSQLETSPYKDAIAASNGTYRVNIPIHFANRRLRRPEDTILNTSRYRNLELTITLGTVADLLTAPGTATITSTVDVDVEKTLYALGKGDAPYAVPYIYNMPPINPANQTYIDIEKNPDLSLLGVLMHVGDTTTAGVPFSGTPSDVTLASVAFEDNFTFPYRSQPWNSFKNFLKEQIHAETTLAGMGYFNFVRNKSLLSSYDTGNKAKCQVNWVNGVLTNSQVSLLLDGWKRLKAGK